MPHAAAPIAFPAGVTPQHRRRRVSGMALHAVPHPDARTRPRALAMRVKPALPRQGFRHTRSSLPRSSLDFAPASIGGPLATPRPPACRPARPAAPRPHARPAVRIPRPAHFATLRPTRAPSRTLRPRRPFHQFLSESLTRPEGLRTLCQQALT
ncbi:hypothetical protein GCM10010145_31080 [Streptomyces ruber]|uniref:Uncharacterized protein n=2 Tax=Streptomyces TaxID=1883 RepID=A0A918BEC2_9ACTN|nr:hypothetical protein GCM10010145_31080 [Streptomyces ruber]